MYWFNNGEKLQYTGGRRNHTIVNWVKKNAYPTSKPITCEKFKQGFQDKSIFELNDVVLTYFGTQTESLYNDAFIGAALSEDNYSFFTIVEDPENTCKSHYNMKESSIGMFMNGQDVHLPYTGSGDKDFLLNWVKINT